MALDETILTFPSDPPKSWRGRIDGSILIQSTQTGVGRPRETSKTLESEQKAAVALDKAVRKKMSEGFVFLRNAAQAKAGEILLDLLAPNQSAADVFDLALDGSSVALGTILKGAYGAEIHLIDVATGRLETIHQEPKGPGQTFLHAVHFDASGKFLIYALNGETRRMDLASGETKALASFVQWEGTNFNPFCVRPSWDGTRQRLLLFDSKDRVRVLDSNLNTLVEVNTASRTNECRCGALSRSGKRLAVYRSSRLFVYGHDDAAQDKTNQVEIWNVDTRSLERTVTVSWKIDRIGFDPSEKRLLFSHEFAQGPGEIALETGAKTWYQKDPYRNDRWGTCFSWGFSPDTRVLAIGGFGISLRDASTHDPCPVQPNTDVHQRVYRIVFSGDGRLYACGGDHGRLQVFKA
jgi:WD40 repeat protein